MTKWFKVVVVVFKTVDFVFEIMARENKALADI